MSTDSTGAAAGTRHSDLYAWFVVFVLLIAALVAYIDRQVVAIVVDPMKADLGVGDTEIGWLYGVFALFYAGAALPIAWLADRKSRKHLIAFGIFAWSLMTMACGLSRSFWHVLLARIGVGVGEATLTPAATSLIGDYFSRDRIPLAMSIFQTGAIMGSGIAFIIGGVVLDIVQDAEPLVLPLVGALAPWQQMFLYVGAPGLLLAGAFLIIREPVRRSPINAEQTTGAQLREVLSFYRRNLHTLVYHHLGFLALALMGFAFVFWSVSFFVRVHGVPAASASQTFGWIFLLTGPVGPIAIALLARHLSRRGYKDANLRAGMLGGLAAIPFILAIQFVPTATMAYVLYVPAMIFVNSPFGIAQGALPVITPPHMRAQVAASYMLVVSFGMMLGPPVAGFFNEHVFPDTEGVRHSLITVTLLFGTLGVALLWRGGRYYTRSMEEADASERAAAAASP